MLAIPAIALRDGHAVLLTADEGRAKHKDLGDPRDLARRWMGHGFRRLHVADLDAESGRGSNTSLVRSLLSDGALPIQLSGGIVTTDAAIQSIDGGADYIVVGTRALEDGNWLVELVDACPGVVIVALEVRNRRVLARNAGAWTRELPRNALDFVEELSRTNLALGGVLVTFTEHATQLQGSDLRLIEDITETSVLPLIVADGIATMGDLRALETRGVAGVVLGGALASGLLDARAVADEFSS